MASWEPEDREDPLSEKPRLYCPQCGRPISELVPIRAELRRRDDLLMGRIVLMQCAILIAVLTDLAVRAS